MSDFHASSNRRRRPLGGSSKCRGRTPATTPTAMSGFRVLERAVGPTRSSAFEAAGPLGNGTRAPGRL